LGRSWTAMATLLTDLRETRHSARRGAGLVAR
jgi:hypothetical protein